MQAMVREAREEAGILIRPEDLEVVHVMHRKAPEEERIDFFIKTNAWKGEPKIMEPQRCDDLRWFECDKLPTNTIPYIRQAIDNVRSKVFYSEHGW